MDFLTVFNNLMHRVNAFEKSVNEIKRLFSSKVVLEHDIGVTTESELKSVDDYILSSLVFVAECVGKIKVLLEIHYCFFVDHNPSSNLLANENDDVDNPNVEISTENKHCLENGSKLLSRCDSPLPDVLDTKLKIYQNKLLDVEKEKERWSLESQLNLVKYEREQKKSTELESRIQVLTTQLQQMQLNNGPTVVSGTTPRIPFATNISSSSSSGGRSLDNNNFAELGSISSTASLHSPVQSDRISCFDDESVDAVRNGPVADSAVDQQTVFYLREKNSSIVNRIQFSDSRAAALQTEVVSLRQRICQLQDDKYVCEKQLLVEKDRMTKMEEEYSTNVNNYEEQLRTMSEHLAGLNEMLASQREEIDQLKYQNQQESNSNKSSSSIVAKSLRKGFKR